MAWKSPWISEPADDPDHRAWETWPGKTAQMRPQDFEIRFDARLTEQLTADLSR